MKTKLIISFAFVYTFCFSQTEEIIINNFYNAISSKNYPKAVENYSKFKNLLDIKYSNGDTIELKARFDMFFVALQVDSLPLIYNELNRLEYLIDKNLLETKSYSDYIINIFSFQKRQGNYKECERLLIKSIENETRVSPTNNDYMAFYLSELAFNYYKQGKLNISVETYLKAISRLEKVSNEDEIISAKYLLSISLFELNRFDETIKYAEECKKYYQKSNSKNLRNSQILNEYRLATAYDSIGNINSSISCSLEFIDLSIQYPENSNEYYFDNISSWLPYRNDSVNFIVSLMQKKLNFWNALFELKPNSSEIKNKVLNSFNQNALYNRSYLEEEDEMGFSVQYDLKSSLNYSRLGIQFCENNHLENNPDYFDIQILIIKNLLDLKDKNLKNELKKATYINKKFFDNSKINSWIIENLECEYLILIGDFAKAENNLKSLCGSIENNSNSETYFLNLRQRVFDNLSTIYFKKGDINKYQFYEDKKKKIHSQIQQNLLDFRLKNQLPDLSDELTYSDSLTYISDSITSYLQNKSALNFNLNDVLYRLEMDSRRIDLNTKDVLSILNLLEHSYNITQQNVKRKNTLIREKELRDRVNMWNDSIYVSFTIGMAHVENELYNTKQSILILEDLKPKVDVTSTYYHTLNNKLAFYYQKLGYNDKALELYQSELNRLKINDQKFKDQKWLNDYLLTLNNLGELYLHLNKVKNAHIYLEEAYLLAKKEFSKNSLQYYNNLKNYVDLIIFSEFKQKSERLLIEENLIAESLFEKKSDDYFSSKNQLFHFYYRESNYVKCDSLFPVLINTFQTNFFENGKGLNSQQFREYNLFFLKQFSLFFEYGVIRKKDRDDFLEEALNLYLTMTKLLNKRENAFKSKDNNNLNLVEIKTKYMNILQLPGNTLEDLMKNDSFKKQIDSIENNYFLSMSNLSFKGNGELNKLRSNLGDNEVLIMNVLHHAMNHNRILIEEDTSYFQEGGVSNYVFVIEKNKPLQFDEYSDENFNLESINSDFMSLTRSLDNSYDLKSKIVSNAIHPTLKRIENIKTVYIYPTDFLSWLNLDVLKNMGGAKYEIENKEFIYVIDPCDINFRDFNFKPSSITFFGGADYNMKIDYHDPFKNLGIIGVEIDMEKIAKQKKALIKGIIPNFPAEEVDLRVDDQILTVNGVDLDTTLKSLFSVYELLKGEIGSQVNLEILRGNKKIKKVLLRKDKSILTKSNYSNLPGALNEINSLSEYLNKNSKIKVAKFTEKLATEDNLKSNLSTDILHLATHSFMIDREKQIENYNLTQVNGVYSNNYYGNQYFDFGIVFCGVNNFNLHFYNANFNNGFLYAGEIQNLDMKEIELVVLSSCESGLANDNIFQTTQGIIGSLAASGAKNAIVSLWKVDDNVTKDFMLCFYKNLIKNSNISKALRETKLEIKKNHPEPYYWAPFVLYSLN